MGSTIKQRLRRFNGTDYDTIHLETDDSVLGGYYTRPNLLDNWYFVGGGSQQGGGQFPINQRGQTSYNTGFTYGIDRWSVCDNWATVTINANSLHIHTDRSQLSYASGMEQPFQLSDIPDGVYTLSCLRSEGLISQTGVISSSATGFQIETGDNISWIGISVSSEMWKVGVTADDGDIIAVKLERGDSQTLAHQDANGNWVLNEVPNYDEQLYRCMTSTADTTDTYANTPYDSLKTSVSSGKAAVAQAVTDKGVTTASDASFSTIATNISSINTRTDGTLDSNAKMLSGYTAYGSGGTKYTGSISSKAAQTYTPTTTAQTIAAGQYLSDAQTISGDANLVAANIKSGVSIFGVAGSLVSKNVYHTTFSPTNSGSTSSFVGPVTWSISGLSTTPTGFIFILRPYYNNQYPYNSGVYLRNLSPVDGSSGWSENGLCPIIWGTSEDISNGNIIHGISVRDYLDALMRGEGMNSKLTVTTSTNTITFTLEKLYYRSNPGPAFVRNGPYDLFYW